MKNQDDRTIKSLFYDGSETIYRQFHAIRRRRNYLNHTINIGFQQLESFNIYLNPQTHYFLVPFCII